MRPIQNSDSSHRTMQPNEAQMDMPSRTGSVAADATQSIIDEATEAKIDGKETVLRV